ARREERRPPRTPPLRFGTDRAAADGRAVRPEAPLTPVVERQADANAGMHVTGSLAFDDAKSSAREIRTVELARDTEGAAHASRPGGDLVIRKIRRSADAHPRQAEQRLERPDEDGAAHALGSRDGVHAVMH